MNFLIVDSYYPTDDNSDLQITDGESFLLNNIYQFLNYFTNNGEFYFERCVCVWGGEGGGATTS